MFICRSEANFRISRSLRRRSRVLFGGVGVAVSSIDRNCERKQPARTRRMPTAPRGFQCTMSRDFVAVYFFLILFAVCVAIEENGRSPTFQEPDEHNDFLNETAVSEVRIEENAASLHDKRPRQEDVVHSSSGRLRRIFFLPIAVLLGFIVLFAFFYNANRRWRMAHAQYVQQRNEALQQQYHDQKAFVHQMI